MMNEKYISVEAAIAEIKADAGCANCCVKMPGRCLACEAGRKIRRIEEIRPADVRPVVRARWEWKNTDALASFAWTCSACGQRKVFKTNFCPNCGADMTGGTNR